MKFHTCSNSPEFFQVSGVTPDLIRYLRYSVPHKFRYFEGERWHIHVSYVVALAELAYTTDSAYLDYSELPDVYQMRIAAEKKGWVRATPTFKDRDFGPSPYSVLHLAENAPLLVVKAAWKALAREYHPDRGGDEDRFKEYQQAYYKIVKE